MKKIAFVLISLLACMPCLAQEEHHELMPEFPGGSDKLMEYIKKNTKYPVEAQKYGASGTVLVTFLINKNGIATDVRTHTTLEQALETFKFDDRALSSISKKKRPEKKREIVEAMFKEAVRVVDYMPNWKPGMKWDEEKGEYKNVSVRFTTPISFNLR